MLITGKKDPFRFQLVALQNGRWCITDELQAQWKHVTAGWL